MLGRSLCASTKTSLLGEEDDLDTFAWGLGAQHRATKALNAGTASFESLAKTDMK